VAPAPPAPQAPLSPASPQLGDCSAHISRVPKDYCVSTPDRPCLTRFEKKQLQFANQELRAGLHAIKAPGCFQHGKTVATMGYFRTGSTLVFNIARLWAALGADGGLVAGFACHDPGEAGINPQESDRCSLVCKDHLLHDGVAGGTDIFLMSRRDVWESLCSRKMMGVWCKKPASRIELKTKEEKDGFQAKCFRDKELERQETVQQCHELMEMQADIYDKRYASGRGVAYDMLMGDFTKDPMMQVQNIGRAMGICDAATGNAGLQKLMLAMSKELHDHPDHDAGITRMHDVHSARDRERKNCGPLREWVQSDAACAAWANSGAAPDQNAALQRRNPRAAAAAAKMRSGAPT